MGDNGHCSGSRRLLQSPASRAPWLGWNGLPRPHASLWEPVPGSGSHYKTQSGDRVRFPRRVPASPMDSSNSFLRI